MSNRALRHPSLAAGVTFAQRVSGLRVHQGALSHRARRPAGAAHVASAVRRRLAPRPCQHGVRDRGPGQPGASAWRRMPLPHNGSERAEQHQRGTAAYRCRPDGAGGCRCERPQAPAVLGRSGASRGHTRRTGRSGLLRQPHLVRAALAGVRAAGIEGAGQHHPDPRRRPPGAPDDTRFSHRSSTTSTWSPSSGATPTATTVIGFAL